MIVDVVVSVGVLLAASNRLFTGGINILHNEEFNITGSQKFLEI